MIAFLEKLTAGQLAGTIALIFTALSALVEISPVKINPWSWLAKKVGQAINGEVLAKVDAMEQRLRDMEEMEEERDAKNARIRILRFGDECQHHAIHSQEHFDQVIEDIDAYEAYCAAHPNFKNNKAVLTIARIKEAYQHSLKEDTFL